jgi:hypothetical protein
MLFTKLKSDEVKGPPIDDVICSQCCQSHFHLCGRVKYLVLELFNLPMFVIRREYEFKCSCGHCKPPCVESKQLKALKRSMFGLSYFASKHAGLFLLMLMMAFQYNAYQQQAKITNTMVANPQVNDFYFVDYLGFDPESHPKFRYTVLKTVEVDENNITLQVGNIFKSRQAPAREQIKSDRAMLDGFFSTKKITLNKAQLAELVQSDIIYEVRRPKNLKIDGWIVVNVPKPDLYVYRVNADNQEGISLYRGENGYERDYVGAFEAFTLAAKASDAGGQTNLAQMYRDGLGTIKNIELALYWFEQAALQDYSQAREQYNALCSKVIDCQTI